MGNILEELIYLDNASTTRVDNRVLEAMMPYFSDLFGNASSAHELGEQSKTAIENSREIISSSLNCNASEIIFTSGSTESINLAIKGFVESNSHLGNHIITAKTEHKAVLETLRYLETKGIEVSYLDVDTDGLISLEELQQSIKDTTLMIAIMYVNNETGVIQDIGKIGQIAKESGICFFTDATQAIGKIEVDVNALNVDMLCFSGHKINGPKGIGILFKREGIELTPQIHGGSQEYGLRAGTHNSPLIVGIGIAVQIASEEIVRNFSKYINLREDILEYFTANNIGKMAFERDKTVPNIISIELNNLDADEFLMINSSKFYASTGSACNSGLQVKSHVIDSIFKKSQKQIIRISI
jgi:cysteine desulfurase